MHFSFIFIVICLCVHSSDPALIARNDKFDTSSQNPTFDPSKVQHWHDLTTDPLQTQVYARMWCKKYR